QLPGTQRIAQADGDALLIDTARWQQLQQQVLDSLTRFHEKYPDEPGINAARLRRIAWPGLVHSQHDKLWRALIEALLAAQTLASSGAWLHLPSHSVQFSASEQALCEQLLPKLQAGRFDPPWVRDLANDTGTGEEIVRQLLRKLARQGQLFQVVKDLFYTAANMDELARTIQQLASTTPNGEVVAREFRDATGLGRKRAIQIIECFDRLGYTRRVRDAHVLRPDAQWHAQS
ncbi:MAG: SelB C-terminal domain-containing protein, partial [Comamonas sp.]|nr:SelB C-terminal domain-containing protein [Candidatus Comamonas equi]